MFGIHVTKTLNKPITEVFDLLADHANYQSFRGIKKSRLLEQGHTEVNGEGALRLIDLGSVKLTERITHFDRPNRIDYLIEKSTPLPFKHQEGSITLRSDGDKTHVEWVSRGYIDILIFGKLLFEPLFESQGAKGFASLLKQIEQR